MRLSVQAPVSPPPKKTKQNISRQWFFFFLRIVLGLELRAMRLLGKCSTNGISDFRSLQHLAVHGKLPVCTSTYMHMCIFW
jgi:hypothetical protein